MYVTWQMPYNYGSKLLAFQLDIASYVIVSLNAYNYAYSVLACLTIKV